MSNEELIEAIQRGESRKENLEVLWNQNSGMINKLAARYEFLFDSFGDAKQSMYFIFVNAVDSYDAEQSKFSTWLFKYAKFLIGRSEFQKVFKVPDRVRLYLIEYKVFLQEFHETHRRNPTDNEIMAGMDITQSTLERIRKADAFQYTESLDEPLDFYDGDVSRYELIASDEDVEAIAIDLATASKTSALIFAGLDTLPEQQQDVLRSLYFDNKTGPEVAKEMDVSAERISAIKAAAFRTLRKIKALREHYVECYARIYHTGLSSFKHTSTSSVESIAMQNLSYADSMKLLEQRVNDLVEQYMIEHDWE